jgi:pepsin A
MLGSIRAETQCTQVTDTGVSGTVMVEIGSPPTEYTLVLDTNSANTWVGARKPYVPTSSSQDTGEAVRVSYGSGGSFSGEEYTDTVSLSPGLVVEQQSIGVASSSTGLGPGVDGILGLGPVDLTVGTLSSGATIPTVVNNLFSQGTIKGNMIAISLNPSTSVPSISGSICFGKTDSKSYTGAISYAPITTTSPASTFWGIDTSFTYGAQTVLASTAGIVDHGTTLLLLATDAFQAYQRLTGGVLDPATELLKITPDQYDALQPLKFDVGGTQFSLTPNAQIWPRSLNSQIGGSPDGIYLIVSDMRGSSGQGLDFMIGYQVLKRFYTVLDTANARVGFATTPYTDATTN